MKSLLVDALRQLEEEKKPEPGAGPEAAPQPETSELELASDAATEVTRASSEEPAVDLDTGDLELAEEEILDLTLDDDQAYPLSSTMTLDVHGKAPADLVLEEAPEQALTAAAVSADAPLLQRIAIYTPVLCLLLGSVAAGGYFAYTYVGALNLNADLGTLPEHLSGQVEVEGHTSTETSFILGPGVKRPETVAKPQPTQAAAAVAAVPVPEEVSFGNDVSVTASRVTPEDLAYPVIEKAYLAWQAGDLAGAERLYREALGIAPGHPNALSGLGAVLQSTGRRQEALPVYEELLSLEPDNVRAAAALLARDDNGMAGIDDIQSLLVQHSRSAPLYFALGSALAGQSRWADARVAFESAFELAPSRADYAFNLAVSLEQVGRYGDALTMYEKALALASERDAVDPGVVVARLNELSSLKERARQ